MRHSLTWAGAVLGAMLSLTAAGVEAQTRRAGSQQAAINWTPSPFKVPAATYTPPKTPWGDPDLQGVWDNHTMVPMERPARLGTKKTYTDEELTKIVAGRGDNEPLCNRQDEACAKASVAQLDRIRAYNSFWTTNQYVYDNRTSLIEFPENGRMPAMTPQALAIQEAHTKLHPPTEGGTAGDIMIDHWEDYDLAERCIAAQSPTSTMGYNSAQYLMQSPGFVMLAHERLNTRVIPLDGRPFLGGTMGGWMGDSRGRWEGNTLVVETRHYTNKQSGGSVGAIADPGIPFTNFTVIEHFVPVGPKRLHYYVTVIDPTTWTQPWMFMSPWEKDRVLEYKDELGNIDGTPEPYQIYEYACHEGNYTMGTTLRAATLAKQKAPTQAARPASELVSSLIGQSEAQIRERFGAPSAIEGPRWTYQTSNGVVVFYAFFEGGKLVRVRPEDLPITDVVKGQ
jgi:hypothetical protein